MRTARREFLGRAVTGAAALTGLAALPADVALALGTASAGSDGVTDWTSRVRGKHRAVFDVPEIDSGYGVWRSQLWGMQMQEALKAKPDDLAIVLVLRHNGVNLAMQQAYWDKYGVGKSHRALHPLTQQSTDRNPALLSSARGEIEERFGALSLDRALERGTIVLGCTLAMEFDVVPTIAKADGVPAEEARKRALALLVPGVIMQPSGVFAAVVAQEAGCHYVQVS